MRIRVRSRACPNVRNDQTFRKSFGGFGEGKRKMFAKIIAYDICLDNILFNNSFN